MPDSYVWEEDDVPVRADVLGARYASTKKVEFVFTTDDPSAVALGSSSVILAQRVAVGTWKKVKKPKDVTGSTFDELAYRAKFALTVDGATITNFTDKVWVYSKQITVTAIDPDDGSKVVGARCRISQSAPGTGGSDYVAVRETDANGQIVFTLKYPAPAKLEWVRPYAGVWTPGKDKGLNREAKVSYGAKMKFIFPTKPKDGTAFKQYVNLDESRITMSLDTLHPEWGNVLQVQAGPANDGEQAVFPGMMVYLRATFDPGNSTRAGAAAAAGQVYQDAQPLNDQLVATFFIDLGHAGGDKLKLEVGGCGQKSGPVNPNKPTFTADDTVNVETWRRLFYQLLAPQTMVDAGKLVASKLADGSDGFDFAKATRDWLTPRLGKDKGFVEFVCTGLSIFTKDQATAARFIDGACLGNTAGTEIYVLGGRKSNTQPGLSEDITGVTWNGTDQQTVYIRLCDWKVDPMASASVNEQTTTASKVLPCPGYLLPVNLIDGTTCITNAKWSAVLAPTAAADHPGRQSNGGPPKNGDIPPEWLDIKYKKKKLKVTLAGDAKNLVGAASATKCPIRITLDWVPFKGGNGSSGGGKQVMVMARPNEAIACTLAHELGHSMGQTVFESNAQGRKKQVPKGLAYPLTVDNGGDTYDDTYGDAGAHCAFGVADRPAGGVAFTFKGKQGATCIMFGHGGDEVPPKRDQYCATCAKYIKARKLDDIRLAWGTRAADDC